MLAASDRQEVHTARCEAGCLTERVRRAYDTLVHDFAKWSPSANFRGAFEVTALAEVRRRQQHGHVRVLEIGCGHGTWAEILYRGATDAGRLTYLGIDLSAPRVEIGRRRLAQYPSATLEVADGSGGGPDTRVDLILAIEVLSHVNPTDYGAWFRRWYRWLSDGGCFIVIDKERFSTHDLRVRWERMRRRLPGRFQGRLRIFPEHFGDLVGTLRYPSFTTLRRTAGQAAFHVRPIFRHAEFRALIGDRIDIPGS